MDYQKVTPEIIEQFEAIAPNRVKLNGDISLDFSQDEMPIYGKKMPDVAIDVTSTEEISKIMEICNEHKIPVTPRGSGTGLVGGAVPILGGVLLNMKAMNQILEYDLENLVVKVQPGVLLAELADDAAKKGLMYAPDPGERFATLGGNVSTNAGGMRAVKYGCTRESVRAMTVVLPTGEVSNFGSSVTKNSSGYSMVNLMVGSEGTLGIITELTLKLLPQPKEYMTLILPYEDLETCINTVPQIFMNHLAPQSIEFMERDIVESSERYVGKQVFPKEVNGTEVSAYLLVTFDAATEDELDATVERASEVLYESGAIDVLVANESQVKKDVREARGSFLEAISKETKLLDECDVVVPINKIAPYLSYIKSIEEEVGLTIKSFGHAGDGNLHIYTCSNDLEEEEFKRRVHIFMNYAYDKATEFGGQVSGEHGIGLGKVEYLEKSLGDVNMRLMQDIKRVFDPNLILNPGKVCYKL
ncbi:FAD-binding oxidoreductase [Bacillus sp. B15-48]|uniref:FAD-binding oxidoreductase n=1 Tax=Bacillus sp. B15-48 TaxID=1548601 RepID=UPI00193FE67B|nr:FAD-binding oxidoreductase [Bacillus sp. B15-48]MBM4763832.1 FAD-binding protein [Bacillus sp. B15-48]